MTTILVDMDGVLADWGSGYGAALDEHGDVARNIRRHHQQETFDLHHGCTPVESAVIATVMDQMSYYDLEPMPGAVDALHEMVERGHEVRIVTSPWITNPTCASDKLAWMMRHFGPEWGRRVIIASDKTLVMGDYLIDDKPEIVGHYPPAWEHIVFDQPYNKTVTQRRLTDWADWKEVIQ